MRGGHGWNNRPSPAFANGMRMLGFALPCTSLHARAHCTVAHMNREPVFFTKQVACDTNQPCHMCAPSRVCVGQREDDGDTELDSLGLKRFPKYARRSDTWRAKSMRQAHNVMEVRGVLGGREGRGSRGWHRTKGGQRPRCVCSQRPPNSSSAASKYTRGMMMGVVTTLLLHVCGGLMDVVD